MSINAYYRREERYEGMQLVYGTNLEAKSKIEAAIEKIKKQTRLNPSVVGNKDERNPEKTAIYIEFSEDDDREGGAFFELVLKELNIEKCN